MGRKKLIKNEIIDKELLLKNCKVFFESLGSNDYLWCDKCHRLNHECYKVCPVVMKVLHNKGCFDNNTNFGNARIVSAEEHVAAGIEGSRDLEEYEETYTDSNSNNESEDYE